MASKGRNVRGKAVQAEAEQRRLSKEEFLQPRIHEEDIELQGFGGVVRVRSLSVRQRKELREQCGFGKDDTWDEDKFTKLMIRETLIEPQLTLEDVEQLEEMNMVLYDQLVSEITVFNVIGKVDEAKKGSKKIRNTGSVSDLRSASA